MKMPSCTQLYFIIFISYNILESINWESGDKGFITFIIIKGFINGYYQLLKVLEM